MPTQPTSSTLKPTSEAEAGLNSTKITELDPWDIADLLICKRDEQPISIELASDDKFDAWVKSNSIAVAENGVTGWSFDDRCRVINYALTNSRTLEFVDGTRIPEVDPEERIPTQALESGECLE